eukprot:5752429-Amphidinium_carterae.1
MDHKELQTLTSWGTRMQKIRSTADGRTNALVSLHDHSNMVWPLQSLRLSWQYHSINAIAVLMLFCSETVPILVANVLCYVLKLQG